MNDQLDGALPVTYWSIAAGTPQPTTGEIVAEALACISLNGQEIATFMCSPNDLDKLALGFLYNEGLINSLDDVRHLRISQSGTCVDVWLHNADVSLPRRQIVTAGCGGGITFDDLSQQHPPLTADARATPTQLADLMRQMHLGATLYQRARGIHTAVLADPDRILLQVEDIGRHNCLDKLCGAALQGGISTHGRIILSSGRISSEMLNKARRLEVPLLCSRTSPTSLSVALAASWNITIVAYLRQDRMRIYTHPQRVVDSALGPVASYQTGGQGQS
ncbi:MAG: formate dehydrogenase accessory sulfurtransferase FdhD [Anaerolineales bacterium]|nr:formate dehydrogenase accessory sulfurtransferase FdhD [Anaerolineales bacterium]